MSKSSKFLTAITATALALVFCLASFITAGAATRKVTTGTTKPSKAPAVKKGTTRVKIKKRGAIVKFKAPETRTYTITFSKVRNYKGQNKRVNGFAAIKENRYGYMIKLKAKTNFGKSTSFHVCSPKYYKIHYVNGTKKPKKTSDPLKTRYAKLKLKKGQTYYIASYLYGVKNAKASYTLNIK